MLEKECSSCQLVVQPEPLSFGNWGIQVGEHEQEEATATLPKVGNNQQEHSDPPQSQALVLQLGQATLCHSLLWNASKEHDRILLEGPQKKWGVELPTSSVSSPVLGNGA